MDKDELIKQFEQKRKMSKWVIEIFKGNEWIPISSISSLKQHADMIDGWRDLDPEGNRPKLRIMRWN